MPDYLLIQFGHNDQPGKGPERESAAVDGEFIIDREHPFTSRYRYLITDAAPDVAWLNAQWEAWAAER